RDLPSQAGLMRHSGKIMLASPEIEPPLGRSCQFVHDRRMDRTDLKILAILQEDASLPVAEVASRVNLSQTPCWRRIQKLTDSGVITRRVALVDPDAVGLGLTVFVEIETGDHSKEWLAEFSAAIADMPE